MNKESFLSLGENTIEMSLRQVNLICIPLTAEAMNNDFVAYLLRTSSDVQYPPSRKTVSALNLLGMYSPPLAAMS